MRVLWLTRAQLPAVTGASSMIHEGWQEGLRQALEQHEPDIELGILSGGSADHEPFTSGNATYFSLPAPRPKTRIGRISAAWRKRTIPWESVRRAVEIGERFRPDIVHLHGTEHFLGLSALQLQPPCVATFQGIPTVLERYMGDALLLPYLAREVPTRAFIRGSGTFHSYLGMRHAARVERQIVDGLKYFMGQTDWDRNVLKLLSPSATYFDCSRALQPAYYGVRWQEHSTPEATIVCTSSAMPYKGVDTLLEGVHLLVRGGYGHVRLRIIGGIPGSPLWPMLSRIVRKRHLEGLVTWLGYLDADEVARELSSASLFVLPSHIENESNALIEAMLVGVPSVAAAVGGVPSVVRDGVDAVLYHDSDPFALASAIAGLLDDPDHARSLGVNARARALARFDPEMCAHRTREVYDQVVALNAGSRPACQSPT
jgi:glycosyltransferase involved in cell wall biosynthesis